jgi:sulfur transfer protein SufE/stress-induced morphogen
MPLRSMWQVAGPWLEPQTQTLIKKLRLLKDLRLSSIFVVYLTERYAIKAKLTNRGIMLSRHYSCLFLMALALVTGINAFLVQRTNAALARRILFAAAETTTATEQSIAQENPLGLTPELLKLANAFEMIGDDKLRYKQLLFMANQLKPIDPASQIPANKVPGCLSTVHVDGTVETSVAGASLVQFVGDSDGLLTKGLVALLVRGLSGNTAADIQKVDPAFITKAGIGASLTPGRNNGFLNMLAAMKRKALELDAQAQSAPSETNESNADDDDDVTAQANAGSDGPMYTAIVTALGLLKPTSLELKDVSYQHAGHVEGGNGVESHFELDIVADAFEGLNLVKRHKLVYMVLGEVMPKIHALQIRAKTPAEIVQ